MFDVFMMIFFIFYFREINKEIFRTYLFFAHNSLIITLTLINIFTDCLITTFNAIKLVVIRCLIVKFTFSEFSKIFRAKKLLYSKMD